MISYARGDDDTSTKTKLHAEPLDVVATEPQLLRENFLTLPVQVPMLHAFMRIRDDGRDGEAVVGGGGRLGSLLWGGRGERGELGLLCALGLCFFAVGARCWRGSVCKFGGGTSVQGEVACSCDAPQRGGRVGT